MPHQILKPEIVIRVYASTVRNGMGSARETAEILGKMGYRNQVTGKPITKQAVLECLRKSEYGKELLAGTSKTKWKDRYADE